MNVEKNDQVNKLVLAFNIAKDKSDLTNRKAEFDTENSAV